VRCRNCGNKANRPRGLCSPCYESREIRARFPSVSPCAYVCGTEFLGRVPLAEEPTAANPGTEEKIRVMTERVRNRQAVFHPQDA
jgi:hypothetical protein